MIKGQAWTQPLSQI